MAKLSVGQALLKAKSHIEEAQKLYHTILRSMPDNIQAQQSLNVLSNLEQLTATQGPPQETINQLVNLYNQGQLTAVVEQVQVLTEQYPKAFIIWNVLGAAHKGLGNTVEASEAFKKVTELNPNYKDGHSNYGVTLKDQDKLEEAILSFNKALSLNPDYAEAYNNMGNALKLQGKLDEAIVSYKEALFLEPDFVDAINNIGIALKDQGKLEEAIEVFNKALDIKPDYADTYFKASFVYNLRGEIQKGLEFYEWRLINKDTKSRPPRERLFWNGFESIEGKKFFVYEEQGLGDIIQFCRYLPILVKHGATVTFVVRKQLHALLSTLGNEIILVDTLPDESQIDFEAPLMSLPHLLNTSLETIPSLESYLSADYLRVVSWGKLLGAKKFKIGICWQGSKGKIDVGRSFPLSLFEGLLKAPNVELISLHKGEGESQIEGISFEVTTLGAEFDVEDDAFLDTAAVMMNCDLIITSDTAVAHLAGALGCQTWVALKHVPDWRWMLNRPDSPWYPTMTLYRQKISGDWGCVFDAINRDLHILLDQKG